MKRFSLIAAISVVLILPFWTSCTSDAGSSRAETADGVKILEVWHPFNTEESQVFRVIVGEFTEQWNAENPGDKITVKLSYVSFDDMYTKLKTAALARIAPDVTFVDASKIADLSFGQALVALEELDGFKERYTSIDDAREEFVRASFDSCVINRKGDVSLNAIPVQTTNIALFWNKKMFAARADDLEAAGLDPERAPRTWDELIAYGEVLTEPDKDIYAIGLARDYWFNLPFLNQYNVQFIDYTDAGEVVSTINSPQTVAALNKVRELTTSGVEGGAWKSSALGPDTGFLNEKYAMCLTGPWNVANFTASGLDFDIALIPTPTAEEVEEFGLKPNADEGVHERLGEMLYTSSNVGGQNGAIMKTTEYPEISYEFLEYFTSEKVQRRWAADLGQIPVRLSAWEGLETPKYPYLPTFMLQMRTSLARPKIPLFGIVESDLFSVEFGLFLERENYTAQQMLDNFDRAFNEKVVSRINSE